MCFWNISFNYEFLYTITSLYSVQHRSIFLYLFSVGSASTCVYSVEYSFSFFYLVFINGCGSACFLWYFTAKWLLMFSLYLLILQFEASTLTIDVHAVSRNGTWGASLLLTHWQEVDWTTRCKKKKALKNGKASKSMPSTVRLTF